MHKYKPPSTWGVEIPQLSELSSPFEALRYITDSLPPHFPPYMSASVSHMWFK